MSASIRTTSCYLIGSDTLLAQCGEVLLEKGFEIRGIVTASQRIRDWAESKRIPAHATDEDYVAVLKADEFDYLFAVTHLALIPDAAVATPRKLAVNFHDGPLPRYAGLNTPMWALLNGESEYAISWHEMTAGIDRGDVLIQQPVTIADDETALSLNTKCFAAALESFPVLLDQLTGGSVMRQKQDPALREYFGRYKRPEAACVLDWRTGAAELDRVVRALNVGGYANFLGSARLWTETLAAIVTTAAAETGNHGTPGEILDLDDRKIRIQCADGVLSVSSVMRLDGRGMTVAEFAEQAGLRAGDILPAPNVDAISALIASGVRDEEARIADLKHAEAPELPQRRLHEADATRERIEVNVPASVTEHGDSKDPVTTVAGFALFLARMLGTTQIDVAVAAAAGAGELGAGARTLADVSGAASLFATYSYVKVQIDPSAQTSASVADIAGTIKTDLARAPWLRDLVARDPFLAKHGLTDSAAALPVAVAIGDDTGSSEVENAEVVLRVADDARVYVEYCSRAYAQADVRGLIAQFERVLETLGSAGDTPFGELDLIGEEERHRLLSEWNATDSEYDARAMIHTQFAAQVARTPDETALVCGGSEISYRHLNERAERLALHLQSKGVGPDTLVGVHVGRSIELMVATLGVLKAGGGYVPLDPAFPKDRLEFMIADSAMPIIITQRSISGALPENDAEIIDVESRDGSSGSEVIDRQLSEDVSAENLAYVIYTSGSTGRPKGVMIEHRNAINFFVGMDQTVPRETSRPGVWLAVTSLSFDISVLELFWTLTRGFKVVIHDEARTKKGAEDAFARPLGLGLFMWGNDDGAGPAKYRLLMEGAKFFDANGFSAVWTPERHFHAFGGPYPNPSVTGAAVAAVTKNIKIRSGSCVMPLHHPVRVAEEWGVVDNLSNGRVQLGVASGWNPNDFVLRPENHKDNKQVMFDMIEQVRALWRGETLSLPGPLGADVEVQSLPRPVQKDLEIWVTTAGNPETWRDAGRRGFHVLTHLLGQSVAEVGEKIRIYRDARKEAGFDPEAGRVALMLHTYVGEDDEEVRELVRAPMKSYLASAIRLTMNFAWSFPAFKRPGGQESKPEDIDISSLSDEEVDTILNFAFERYFETSGLFGTVDTCYAMLEQCSNIGVDEIACLFDFGVATDDILTSLPRLNQLRGQVDVSVARRNTESDDDYSFAAMVERHAVTHMQCTPSMARLYGSDDAGRKALAAIPHLLLGGEALPLELARDLAGIRSGTLTNMYGPTETTIWSMTQAITDLDAGIPIGRPIANTQIYVLDKFRRPVPTGTPGELYIGGDGVARGYLNRPELTAERFADNPFSERDGARMYATGDLACYRSDGVMDFIGRADFQVKVRGYRIELGEIESVLEAQESVREAAVIVRADDASDQRLVAYVVATSAEAVEASELRQALRRKLPEYMVPNEFGQLDDMPRTANGKLDRKALLEMKPKAVRKVAAEAAPSSDTEKTIADLWKKTLRLDSVGVNENFFDLGGHSLLVVQLHGELKKAVSMPVSLTDLYQYPTIRSLSEYLSSGSAGEALQRSASRGARRRALRKRSA